ncbi:MAG: radical SAM protein [Fuerstiella sp.]|jgi:wyosine [tRNA(Phe)-imidazoG37] synthetase (radical SAM superfamily)|nr:radical SAM protein [Fuerstiella sp.]
MMPDQSAESAEARLFQQHSRLFETNRFVYPVVSRRSQGVSVGINLNPDKVCNFDCVYCQVDRRSNSETRFVETDQLLAELTSVLQSVASGDLFRQPQFACTPHHLRRLNDIAFSGDGEPTTFRNFDEIIAQAAGVRRKLVDDQVKMVLITNASMLHREHVGRGLRLLDENNGQIWAKLEAGTEKYFKRVERTTVPFQRILDNITAAAIDRPLVVQSLFMNLSGEPPPASEIDAFCQRLRDITASGGQLEMIQVYTVARQPAESFVSPLTELQLRHIADTLESTTGLKAAVFS